MRRHRMYLLVCVLFLGMSAAGTGQGQGAFSPSGQGPQRLQPEAESDPGPARVEIAYLADGRRLLTVAFESGQRVDAFMYHVIADPVNGTYRGFQITGDPRRDARVLAYLRSIRRQYEARGQTRHFEAFTSSEQTTDINDLWRTTIAAASEEPPPICTYCQNTCNGSGFSRAITWDPVYIELTHTDITLNWAKEDSPRGCRWVATGYGSCWAANPSTAGTHWYVDNCPQRYVEAADSFAFGFQGGVFHNNDFGLDALRTDVSNHATVEWLGGNAIAHGYQFSASGEWYFFLDATVAGAHFNNCP